MPERWPRPSARTLVKLLAVAPGHRLHRVQVMDVCWPDADRHSALRSLRVALHAARRALEPELAARTASSYLTTDGPLLWLEPDTVRVDVDETERLAVAALADGGIEQLPQALAAFTGELLPEDQYAPWARQRRRQLVELRTRLRLATASAQLADGLAEDAAAMAQAVLDDAPADERAHQLLMNAYLLQGLPRQAVRQFHRCREQLDAELGIRPGPDTERLHLLALGAPGGGSVPSPGSALPPALRVPPSVPLHGRDKVLAELLGPDAPPVQLLGGEAGLGKTRLVTEVARRAAAEGALVLWGAGHDAEGRTPYGAFVEALDGWLADRPASDRARIGAEYPELSALLPSLGRANTDAARSPEEERDRLFAATAALLRDLAATAPVLLVLDDLHAADAGSFQLLSHLARRAAALRPDRCRVLVTYRTDELGEDDPRRATFPTLERAELARHVPLERLDRAACLALAASVLDLPAGTATLQQIWELSLGNPLFTLELARELGEQGTHDKSFQTPRGVRQLVAARLARLAPAARRVVEVVAVTGGHAALFEVLDVAASTASPRTSIAEITAGADAAVAASVLAERAVVVDGRAVPGLAFRHPLVRLTCYEQLSTARRRLLHSAYADAVRRRSPDAIDTLAAHLGRASDPRATGYLRQAAERAAALCANDTADQYYAELTSLLDGLAADAAWARIDRSAVLQRMGRYEDAARILREAMEDLRRRSDADGLVLAAGRLADVLADTRGAQQALALLEEHPPHPDTSPRAVTTHHTSRALNCLVVGRYPEAVAAARSAAATAEHVTGVQRLGLLARALTLQAIGLALDGRFAEAGRTADEALPHATAFGEPRLLGAALSVQREQARRSGRLREAVETGYRALALAERAGAPAGIAFERANLAELHLLLEEQDKASEHARLAMRSAAAEADWSLPYALLAQARVTMRTRGGDPDELLEDALRAAREHIDSQAQHEVLTARAEWQIRAGRPEAALALLDEIAGGGAAHIVAWAHLAAGRAHLAAELAANEAARAEAAGERLTEVGARTVQGAALAALRNTPESARCFAAASTQAALLPYPAGLRDIELAQSRTW
ncbi:AAA family ATPase [Streptomyces sp. YC504]|uniref:AAA family ATPase n=1 Tax=Streptomyces mesophilus TaxID=1775132 RepID=A0A6G4X9L0_9ACTN|nr:AAA family ATPase [Streptomyces mesophilus]NGO74205.1 AAA family ATPase [Streptomyces mesophilus]